MGGTCVAENEQVWVLWTKYSLVFIIQNGIQQVNVSNTVCFTAHKAYGKQTCTIPTQCHVCTNIHCYPFSLKVSTCFTLSWPQHNSGPHRTWCNCLKFDFWIICCCPDNQWPTDQDRQCTCNIMLWHKNVTCCHAQAVHITQSVCVCILAIVTQHANCMCHIMSFVTSLTVQYFTFSKKWCDFLIKILKIKCLFRFSTNYL